jgi:biotin transport system permease protein
MLSFEPGGSFAHRLDPRAKLAVQSTFAAAAFVYTSPRGLLVLSALTAGILTAARTPLFGTLHEYRFLVPFLLAAPLLEASTWGSPWIDPVDAVPAALAGYRVLLVVLVAAAYVRTTPVRSSRAAIQWAVPGRAGRFLGMGTASVFRFLPVLRADLTRIREAHKARLGDTRPVGERMSSIALAAINRAFDRADTFALALQARCFAWNPTLPALRFGYRDVPALALAAALTTAAVLGAI